MELSPVSTIFNLRYKPCPLADPSRGIRRLLRYDMSRAFAAKGNIVFKGLLETTFIGKIMQMHIKCTSSTTDGF
jgi:hypothetical protein